MRKCFLVFSWLIATATAHAGEYSLQPSLALTPPAERLVPHQGGWWNAAEPGSGYFFEFSQNADGSLLGLATTYTYDDAGKSTFLIVQGPVVFSTEAERLDTGIIARLSSPLFKAENGQSFGGTYRPATVSPSSFGAGEYVFFTRRTGEFRAGGRTTPIRALSPLATQAEYVRLLSGTWKLQGRMRRNAEAAADPSFDRSVSHVVKITLSQVQPTWAAGRAATWMDFPEQTSYREFWRPTPSVMTFDVECLGECPPVPHPLGNPYQKFAVTYDARIWVDVATGRAGYVTGAMAIGADPSTAYWATQDFTAGPEYDGGTNWTFDLFIDDVILVGRGGVINTFIFWPQKFSAGSEIVLTKINEKTGQPGNVKIY